MKIVNLKNYKKAVGQMVETIRAGGLVVFPSDSVYGLGVDPTNQKAVDKLLAFKKRWPGKGISIAVANEKMAVKFVRFDKNTRNIYKNLLPGPFTVVSRGKHKTAKGIEAEDGSLGIRIPNYQFIIDVVKGLGKPITATSANLSGKRPHYSVKSFLRTLSKKKAEMIDLVVNGEKLPRNKPSTVINLSQGRLKVLRRGDLVPEEGASLVSKSEKQTRRIGTFLVKKYAKENKALVVGLVGDLGAGKTVMARGIGKALGVKERIVSPTFTICNEYKLQITNKKVKFLHFDLYRIEDRAELEELRFLEMFKQGVIACIEWPERIGKKMFEKLKRKTNYVGVRLEYVDKKSRRIRWGKTD